MATYDPAVKAALQQALPGYTVTDDDATWWTNNGGVVAVKKQWPQQFMEAVPQGTMVNPRPAGDATVSEYQPAAGAEEATRRNAILSQFSQLKTKTDLDRFLATSPFTAEEINAVFPEYAVADLKREQSRAFRAMQGGSTIPEDVAAQLDALLQPNYGASRLQGGLNYSGLYSNEQAARDYIQRATQPRTGPEVLGGYHTTDGRYIEPALPTVPTASVTPMPKPGMMSEGGSSNPFFGGGQPWPVSGGSSGPNPFLNTGGGGMMGGNNNYIAFSSLLQPFMGQSMLSGAPQQPVQQGPVTWDQQAYGSTRPNLPPGVEGLF